VDTYPLLYFIEKGIARAFYNKRKQEITAWFMLENDLSLSVNSLFKQKLRYKSIVVARGYIDFYLLPSSTHV
jgi:hypothetical protein